MGKIKPEPAQPEFELAKCGSYGDVLTPNSKSKVVMPCKVCELVDGDNTEKQVVWCSFCGAYVCNSCRLNIPKRAAAFTKNAIKIAAEKINPKKQPLPDTGEIIDGCGSDTNE